MTQGNRGQSGQQRNFGSNSSPDIVRLITDEIRTHQNLSGYGVRDLVVHAEKFGPHLKQNGLETNQIRKFLDAINRLKVRLSTESDFQAVEAEVVLLKPKLAYAAARQKSAKDLSTVMSLAIDRVKTEADFYRLVQLIESTIAYHKAEGGK
jgi:CRISPR-associated protein Csm2